MCISQCTLQSVQICYCASCMFLFKLCNFQFAMQCLSCIQFTIFSVQCNSWCNAMCGMHSVCNVIFGAIQCNFQSVVYSVCNLMFGAMQSLLCIQCALAWQGKHWKARARQESKWCKKLSATCTPEYIFQIHKYK